MPDSNVRAIDIAGIRPILLGVSFSSNHRRRSVRGGRPRRTGRPSHGACAAGCRAGRDGCPDAPSRRSGCGLRRATASGDGVYSPSPVMTLTSGPIDTPARAPPARSSTAAVELADTRPRSPGVDGALPRLDLLEVVARRLRVSGVLADGRLCPRGSSRASRNTWPSTARPRRATRCARCSCRSWPSRTPWLCRRSSRSRRSGAHPRRATTSWTAASETRASSSLHCAFSLAHRCDKPS